MIILSIRTDKPEAEIGLFDNDVQLSYETWMAHRQLAETLHGKIRTLLSDHDKTWHDIEAVVCFQGPGSFTGLRIGISVANALAYGLDIPLVTSQGSGWLKTGVQRILAGQNDKQAQPFYGAEAHITPQKK